MAVSPYEYPLRSSRRSPNQELINVLSKLCESAYEIPDVLRNRLQTGELDVYFNFLLRERKHFTSDEVCDIQNHIKDILRNVGDSWFSLKEDVVVALMSETVGNTLPLLSLDQYFAELSLITEAKPNHFLTPELFAAAKFAVLQAVANQNLANEKSFLDIVQLSLEAETTLVDSRVVISATALKSYCGLALTKYLEFKSLKDCGETQVQCYLLKLAIEFTKDYCRKLCKDHSVLNKFQENTFRNITNALRGHATDDILHVLKNFFRTEPYDFHGLSIELNKLERGHIEGFKKFESLRIPKLPRPDVRLSLQPAETSCSMGIKSVVAASVRSKITEMLNALGLSDRKYILLWHVLKVSKTHDATNAKWSKSLCYANLPELILKKILMINYKGREMYFKRLPEVKRATCVSSFLLEDDALPEIEKGLNGIKMNPLDVLLLIYNCCHPSLKQVFLEKLVVCKLAVPFIHLLNNGRWGISSWALRSIIIDWKDERRLQEKSAVNCALEIKSAVRIGRPKISKSEVLNQVLYDDTHHHNTFFHHNCTWGQNEKIVSDGLVEAAFYCASDADTNRPQNSIMILNLRGDAVKHQLQMKYLNEISSSILVVVSVDELTTDRSMSLIGKVLENNTKLTVLIVPCSDRTLMKHVRPAMRDVRCKLTDEKFNKVSWVCGFRDNSVDNDGQPRKSDADVAGELKKIFITPSSRPCATLSTWIELGGSEKFGFVVDEDDVKIRTTKIQAEDVFAHAKTVSLENIRRVLLPLQGIHWKNFSEQKKKCSRETNGDNIVKLRHGQIHERNEQLKILIERSRAGNPLLETFISYLLKYESSDDVDRMMFFMQWLKLFMDEHTREHLPAAAKEYRDVVRQLRAARKEDAPDLENIRTLEKEEEIKERILSESSFGLEHVMREVAQVYEAVKEYDDGTGLQEDVKLEYEALPRAAAKLLLMGFPLELMDGDVGNIPLTWIRSVLHHAQCLVGDKKVFVLSVLGIQSSGKSTLLNTMFGLRFAVSAGRCTRGIFMQLLPVDSPSGYEFDYVLVIDTEGLRSSELQNQHYEHDNELATLVIGLGDLTILNIKGGDLSEVKDILEIAVQAFLKMKVANKNLNLQQSCVFVHQNVSAVNAASQMEHGHLRLQNILDKMTEEAARQVQNSVIRSFNQVINYDGEKHIQNFSDLWEGDPPMAPANPGYSACAARLRKMIMKDIAESQYVLYSFSNLAQHAKDLWSGIIGQDFIFSFRNCLEIRAYSRLEDLCCQLQFDVDQATSTWVRDASADIRACNSEEELKRTFSKLVNGLEVFIEAQEEKSLVELEHYFDSIDDLRHISIQWKGERYKSGKLGKFCDFVKECRDKAKQHIQEMKDSHLLSLQQHSEDNIHKEKFLQTARQLAEALMGSSFPEQCLREEFDSIWSDWERDFVSKSRTSVKPISERLTALLYKYMEGFRTILMDELNEKPISLNPNLCRLVDAVKTEDVQNWPLSVDHSERANSSRKRRNKEIEMCQLDAAEFLKSIFAEIETELNEVVASGGPFQDVFASKIIMKVKEDIRKKNSPAFHQAPASSSPQKSGCRYTMQANYTAKALVTVARYMNVCFGEMQEEYESEHGIEETLIRYREQVYSVFEAMVFQTAAEVSAANSFWSIMSEWMKETVLSQMMALVPGEVKVDFGLAKNYLLKQILKDLANGPAEQRKHYFDNYMRYIKNAESFALEWITNYTNNKYFQMSERGTEFELRCYTLLETLLNNVMQSVFEATKAVNGAFSADSKSSIQLDKVMASDKAATKSASYISRPSMQDWVDTFCSHLQNKKFAINRADLHFLSASAETTIDFGDFESFIKKKHDENSKKLKEYFCNVAANKRWVGETPYQSILDTLWGCRSQCPFCLEPCKYMSRHEKEHMCIQHRPQCIGGQSWVKNKVLVTASCNSMINKPVDTKFLCLRRTWRQVEGLDLVFLLDATGSMKPYIEQIRDHIEAIVADVKREQPNIRLNLAFVGYRDHCDGDNRVTVLPFTTDVRSFKNFVTNTKAFGGGDGAEDVFGGLEEVGKLGWTSASRILIHFADASCHGTRFHNYPTGSDDYGNYNASDVRGLTIEALLSNLERNNVKYYFGKINDSTDKMISEFNRVSEYVGFITVRDASSLSLVGALVSDTVTASLRGMQRENGAAPLPGPVCDQTWHSYRNYKTCASEWEIAPEQGEETSLYWKRFLYVFQDELKNHYEADGINIDPAWGNISLIRALESLDDLRG